jgi:hypothetical protein
MYGGCVFNQIMFKCYWKDEYCAKKESQREDNDNNDYNDNGDIYKRV